LVYLPGTKPSGPDGVEPTGFSPGTTPLSIPLIVVPALPRRPPLASSLPLEPPVPCEVLPNVGDRRGFNTGKTPPKSPPAADWAVEPVPVSVLPAWTPELLPAFPRIGLKRGDKPLRSPPFEDD